jgi:hypothetical protein
MAGFEYDKRSWVDEGSWGRLNVLGGKGPDMYFASSADFARTGVNLWKARRNDKGISNCDIYSNEPFDWILNLDLITSIHDHGGFAIEFNSSALGEQISNGLTDDEYRACMWSGIGHGLKGGNIWGLRRLPPMNYSLRHSCVDGDNLPLAIGMELIRLNNQSRLLSELMSGALPPRERVAVYFPHETFNQKFNFKDQYPWAVELCGLHEMMYKAGYNMKFISDENIEEIDGFKTVVIPYAPIIPQKTNTALHDYVQNGGRLLTFGIPASHDELMVPSESVIAEPLRQVYPAKLSVSSRSSGVISDGNEVLVSIPDEYVFTESAFGNLRKCLESKPYVQLEKYPPLLFDIDSASAEILAEWEDETPAIIENTYGNGSSVFCGFLPGEKYLPAASGEQVKMQSWIRGLMGVSPCLVLDNQHIESGLLKNRYGYFLVLVNRSDEIQSFKLEINVPEIEETDQGRMYDLLRQAESSRVGGELTGSIEPRMPLVYFSPVNK